MSPRTVLFYNDSEVFGGHEVMSARIMNRLAAEDSTLVHCMHHTPAFGSRLDSRITTTCLPFHTKSRTLFLPGGRSHIGHIRRILSDIKPDLMIVAQGYAESAVRGLLAGRASGIPTYSYIPFGNNNTELNNRFATLRDMICRFIYRMPRGYITISAYQARLLARFTRGGQDIHVIHNPAGFDYSPPAWAPLPRQGRLDIAVVGRVVFKQKNQSVLIPLARALVGKMDFAIHVVGDGPDLPRLKTLVTEAGLDERFCFHGWMEQAQLVPFLTGRIHAILIPSLYEGLPLILLEALYLNKPFLISDLGLLEDYAVPARWRFDPRNPAHIADRVLGMGAAQDADEYAALRERVLSLHSEARFGADVDRVFGRLLDTLKDGRSPTG